MSIVRRIYAALGANLTSQAITVLIQLISVPIFLYCWSVEKYGQWMILTAVPSYFALADFGFLAVTINKMTIVAATNNIHKCNVLFQTAIKLCLYAIVGATTTAILFVIFINTGSLGQIDNKIALIALVVCAILAMSSGLVDAVFRSSGEFALGLQITNVIRLIEWAGLLTGLFLGRTFVGAAVGQLLGRLIGAGLGWRISSWRHPDIRWSIVEASNKEFREMLKPALSFMLFPVANAISIQGMILVVGYLFGPAFVVVFSTYRTITRILVQAVTIIGRSLWPEISRSYGEKDINTVILLYRKGTFISIILAASLCIFLIFFGEYFLQLWTTGKVSYEKNLFHLFLLMTMITSFWQMGVVVLSATNSHMRLSISYLIGAIASVSLVYVTSGQLDKYAPILGMICFEIYLSIMCVIHIHAFKRKFWLEK